MGNTPHPEMQNLQLLKLAFVTASAFLFLTPSVKAIETREVQPTIATTHPSEIPVLLAQSFCGAQGMKPENYFETDNFIVHICYNSRNQLWYYGIEKGSRASTISLPAYRTEEGYGADNGDYSYLVNGIGLTIYHQGQEIQQDNITGTY